ncbi:MAG: hypothetical protein AAF654_10910 [Myxococcota bacterium]
MKTPAELKILAVNATAELAETVQHLDISELRKNSISEHLSRIMILLCDEPPADEVSS